jgi:threonine/homoserine/homoserine lactone efflux protein
MKQLELLLRGVLAGLAIAIPVGPVNILCISRTIAGGRVAGLISGLGAATADTLYGAIAGFSISLVINFLIREKFWIRLVGGALLVGIGLVYWFARPKSLKEAEEEKESAHSAYMTTLLLTLTNPTTVLSYMAVLAALRLGQPRPWTMTLFLVLGIFCGSMIWWIVLAAIAGYFRDRFTDKAVVWMNRIAAFSIAGFGILTMLIARK